MYLLVNFNCKTMIFQSICMIFLLSKITGEGPIINGGYYIAAWGACRTKRRCPGKLTFTCSSMDGVGWIVKRQCASAVSMHCLNLFVNYYLIQHLITFLSIANSLPVHHEGHFGKDEANKLNYSKLPGAGTVKARYLELFPSVAAVIHSSSS